MTRSSNGRSGRNWPKSPATLRPPQLREWLAYATFHNWNTMFGQSASACLSKLHAGAEMSGAAKVVHACKRFAKRDLCKERRSDSGQNISSAGSPWNLDMPRVPNPDTGRAHWSRFQFRQRSLGWRASVSYRFHCHSRMRPSLVAVRHRWLSGSAATHRMRPRGDAARQPGTRAAVSSSSARKPYLLGATLTSELRASLVLLPARPLWCAGACRRLVAQEACQGRLTVVYC